MQICAEHTRPDDDQATMIKDVLTGVIVIGDRESLPLRTELIKDQSTGRAGALSLKIND
jgi:hypothetical protein